MATYVGDTDGGIDCTITLTSKSSLDGWLANRGGGIADFGDCSASFTSIAPRADLGTQKKYTVHGSVTANLAARSGNATGTVVYSARF